LGVSPTSPPNRYPLWSATAYGIIIKHENNTYSLAETGRKILAPTYEGEKEEGIKKKALFTLFKSLRVLYRAISWAAYA
jgi:hypothetical protein